MSAACTHVAPARPSTELADVFRAHGEMYAQMHRLSSTQRKAARAIVQCRTAALGGQRESCPRCGYSRYRYHSCRNRHCPKCQSLAKAQWLEARQQELLPTPYFHNVFTLPPRIRHYGILANRGKKERLGKCRKLLGALPPEPTEPKALADWILLWTGEDPTRCPKCGCAEFVTKEIPRPDYEALPVTNPDDFW